MILLGYELECKKNARQIFKNLEHFFEQTLNLFFLHENVICFRWSTEAKLPDKNVERASREVSFGPGFEKIFAQTAEHGPDDPPNHEHFFLKKH